MTHTTGSVRGRAAVGCPSPVLAVRGVTQTYGALVAVDDVSLTAAAGSVVGLVGPNGSGKTTLIHAVAGLLRPAAGRILVCGAVAGSISARRRVALVPDEPAGLDELTVDEHVALVRSLWRGGEEARRRAELLLDVFGLASRRGVPIGRLSRGLRRRASMVAALQLAAPLTLVDEATAALDPEAVVALRESMTALAARGSAVLLASQDLHFAHAACDEVVLLARGRVVAAAAPDLLGRRRGVAGLEDAVLDAIGETDLRRRVRDGLAAL